MDAGGDDLFDAVDRAAQLALQRALHVDLIGELSTGQRGAVEYLEADAGAAGEALAGQLEAQLVELGPLDHDRSALTGQAVGDIPGAELFDDGSCAFRLQAAVEEYPIRLHRAAHDQPEHHKGQEAECDYRAALASIETRPYFRNLIFHAIHTEVPHPAGTAAPPSSTYICIWLTC